MLFPPPDIALCTDWLSNLGHVPPLLPPVDDVSFVDLLGFLRAHGNRVPCKVTQAV